MLRHIVIINFIKNNEKDFSALLESTRTYVAQIPSVVSYDIFINESAYTPENIESFGVEIFFKNKAGLEEFMKHPKHYEANALFEQYLADPPFMVLTHQVGSTVNS
ncbi:MAG: hypothetical protein S4CHLAM20_06940 [Chlamydiia bacterium]|nr:hypothetical protein [Chlamydiia bacterium]